MPSPKYTRAGSGEKSDRGEEKRPKDGPSESSTFQANQPTPPRSNLLTYLTRKNQPYEKFQADMSDLDDFDDDELAEATAALGDQSSLSLSSPVPGAPLPANYSHSSPSDGKATDTGTEDEDDDEVLWCVLQQPSAAMLKYVNSLLFFLLLLWSRPLLSNTWFPHVGTSTITKPACRKNALGAASLVLVERQLPLSSWKLSLEWAHRSASKSLALSYRTSCSWCVSLTHQEVIMCLQIIEKYHQHFFHLPLPRLPARI